MVAAAAAAGGTPARGPVVGVEDVVGVGDVKDAGGVAPGVVGAASAGGVEGAAMKMQTHTARVHTVMPALTSN